MGKKVCVCKGWKARMTLWKVLATPPIISPDITNTTSPDFHVLHIKIGLYVATSLLMMW
jgi:hypothetical protein